MAILHIFKIDCECVSLSTLVVEAPSAGEILTTGLRTLDLHNRGVKHILVRAAIAKDVLMEALKTEPQCRRALMIVINRLTRLSSHGEFMIDLMT